MGLILYPGYTFITSYEGVHDAVLALLVVLNLDEWHVWRHGYWIQFGAGRGREQGFSCSPYHWPPKASKCPTPLREVSHSSCLKLYLPTSSILAKKWHHSNIHHSQRHKNPRGHLVQLLPHQESPLYNLPKCHQPQISRLSKLTTSQGKVDSIFFRALLGEIFLN